MKGILPILFLLAGLPGLLYAQTTIKGEVRDSSGLALPGASVLLLQEADSVLSKFAITEHDGSFSITEIPAGDYWLRITYVGYDSYTQSLQLGQNQQLSLGKILLKTQAQHLETVVVEAEHAPIAIRGDTIQYNANAFETRPNASVEELLKRLPGVEVDRNGNIRAQGKEVDKILVDGKEFFGDDPKVASQNLPADIVDKVQVYDRKSEIAAFTGVDDGERNTTINLDLKEDKKQGFFGTAEAGYGTADRFSGKGNINRFAKNYQLSALGRYNNINQQGFTIQDYFNLMGGMQNFMSNGSMTINPSDLGISMGDDNRSNGIATTAAGGLNLNYDVNDRTELLVNYFFNQVNRDLDQQTERQYFQGDDFSFSEFEDEDRRVVNTNHRLNSKLKYEIDSTQHLQLSANLGFNDMELSALGLRESLFGSSLGNSMNRAYGYNLEQFNLESRAIYKKRLSKPGRSFVMDGSYSTRDGLGNHSLASITSFPEQPVSDSLFQNQREEQGQHQYNVNLSYTEPLGKGHFLEFRYLRQNYREASVRDFFDLLHGQRVFNETLSNRFQSDYTYDQAVLRLQRNRKKYNMSVGLAAQEARLQGQLQSESSVKRRFSNLLPSLNLRYNFTDSKRVSLTYRTNVQEPSVEQLQPILDNSDPLRLYKGNPNLQPEYRHDLQLQSLIYDPFSFTSLFAMINATYTQNRITQATDIDENLRQVIQPVNIDEDYFINGTLSFSTPIPVLKSRIELSTRGNFNRSFLLLNGLSQSVDRWNGTFSLTLENRNKDVFDLLGGVEWQLQRTVYESDESLNQQFDNQSYFLEGSINFSDRWQVGSRLDYLVFPKGSFADQQDFPLWEVNVSRFLGERQQLEIRISVFDLLDQNQGIIRNASFNYIENKQVVALGRYFMLSAVYNFKGFGK